MVRPHELACCHGIGHQLGVHGCDGCCGLVFGDLTFRERERIIALLEQAYSASMKVPGSVWPDGINTAITLIKGLSDD